jgi:heme oxygenase
MEEKNKPNSEIACENKDTSGPRSSFNTSYPYVLTNDVTTSASTSATSSPKTSDISKFVTIEALQLLKNSCPAFKSNCPFKDVQDAESMKAALESLPPSHFTNDTNKHLGGDMGNTLKIALAHVHTVSSSIKETDDDQQDVATPRLSNYVIPGDLDDMEKFSLFALMGKLIEQTAISDTVGVKKASTPIGDFAGKKRSSSSTSLSHALKHGTQESHSAAESVHFVKEFIKGNIDKDIYGTLIKNLYFLYKELEPLLDEYAPKCFPTLHFPKELSRTEALRDDVDYFHGERALDGKLSASTATLDLVGRIQYIAEEEPLLLLSHAYTRYLGDLSGGKILARVAKRALNLQDIDSGLDFYQFDEIPSVKIFKDNYRRALDELSLTNEEIERLVAEANVAFVLNMRIFEELDVLSGIPDAKVRDYSAATVYYEDCLQRQKDSVDDFVVVESSKKCPFAILGGANPHKNPLKESKSIDDKEDEIAKAVPMVETVNPGMSDDRISKTNAAKGKCPWPFIFLHDPLAGMQDYQTWIVLGLLLCYTWSLLKTPLLGM